MRLEPTLAHLRGAAAESTFPVFRPRTPDVPRFDADVAGDSIQGARHAHNDDHFLVVQADRRWHVRAANLPEIADAKLPSPTGLLAVVADGISGHRHGELASAVALDALVGGIGTRLLGVSDLPEDEQLPYAEMVMTESVVDCQERLHSVAERKRITGDAMGTTLTAAYVEGPSLYVAHVGDSRAYLLHEQRLTRLTTDHTLAEQLRRAGYDGPFAPAFEHRLVNAVGGDEAVPRPEIVSRPIAAGDRLLLCTDGLTNEIDDATILDTLRTASSARDVCTVLVEAAQKRQAPDDVTVVAVCF